MLSLISSALNRYIGIPVVCDYELVLYSRDFCRCAIVLIEILKLVIRNKESEPFRHHRLAKKLIIFF